jgi:predicted Zn-dependent peptidase
VLYIGLDHARIALAREKIASILSGVISGSLLTPEEFEDVKRKIAGRYLLDHQTVLRQGWYLGFWEMTGFGFAFDERYPEAIRSLQLEDFRADVQAVLVPAHETRVELVPR